MINSFSNTAMKFLLSLILILIGFYTRIFSQNPLNHLGRQHNFLLQKLLECNNPKEYCCLNSITNYTFNNYITYGNSEILSYLDYVNLSFQEKQTILEFINTSDTLPIEIVENLIDSLEKDAIKKQSSFITLGFWSVAKHSLQFWKNYQWDDDKKPPFMAIVKADALGLIKGVVLGAVFWVGSNFLFDVPDAIGIIGGSTIAVGFTALDSFRFSKKYKKRTES